MATLSYSYGDGIVWVEDLIPEPHPMVHDLCAEHAKSVKVPRGWELRDMRGPDVDVRKLTVAGTVTHVRFDLIGA